MAITMIQAVPVSTIAPLLNPMIIAIPITAPGIIYGIMDIVSITLLMILRLLTTRYEISMAITTMITSAPPQIRMVFQIAGPRSGSTFW